MNSFKMLSNSLLFFLLVCSGFSTHTQPVVRQQKPLVLLFSRKKSICYALIERTAEDTTTRNIFLGKGEESWRESKLGTIKIARNSGALTSRRIQGHQGKYIKC